MKKLLMLSCILSLVLALTGCTKTPNETNGGNEDFSSQQNNWMTAVLKRAKHLEGCRWLLSTMKTRLRVIKMEMQTSILILLSTQTRNQ